MVKIDAEAHVPQADFVILAQQTDLMGNQSDVIQIRPVAAQVNQRNNVVASVYSRMLARHAALPRAIGRQINTHCVAVVKFLPSNHDVTRNRDQQSHIAVEQGKNDGGLGLVQGVTS